LLSFKALEKVRLQLAEANAAAEARKRAPEDSGPKILGEGLVIDEWVSMFLLNKFIGKVTLRISISFDRCFIYLYL